MEFDVEALPPAFIRFAIISNLRPREARILMARHGIGEKRRTLADLSVVFRISAERVRQVQRAAEAKFRALLPEIVRSLGMDRRTLGDDLPDLMGSR